MLLWRQATPWLAVSASSRKVVAATPPTPGVLQTAALGGNGPGWSGHWPLPVHCALVIEHLPIAGHSARSTPGVVQAALVMLHFMFCGRHCVAALAGVQVVPVTMLQWPTIAGQLVAWLAAVQRTPVLTLQFP
jgi:hypothetical protein